MMTALVMMMQVRTWSALHGLRLYNQLQVACNLLHSRLVRGDCWIRRSSITRACC
jgi:hypothetical protein